MRAPGLIVTVLLLAGCIPGGERPAPPPPRTSAPTQPREFERRQAGEKVSQLPAPAPAWEARPVEPDAAVVADQRITVVAGDSLGAIATRTSTDADAIARANGLAPPFVIYPGQELRIPGGRYHLVRKGQTGIAIARAYGVEWSRIVAENALVEPYILRAGQRIAIPGGTRAPSAAERAAAFTLDVDDILTGGEPALAANQAPAKPVATVNRVLPITAAVVDPVASPRRFSWPVDGKVVKRFGKGGTGERNDGIKIAVPLDTPVHATADGTVAYVGDGIAALGGLVIVKHGGGWTSVYGHASKLLVQRGQAVKRGQAIALSGDTGFADRPELHFELREGRTPVDPTAELPKT